MEDFRKTDFRSMLVKLDSLIRPDELEKLKFLCKDHIPTKTREKLDSGVKFFEALEERELLTAENLNFLKSLLSRACEGRTDVINEVTRYENTTLASTQCRNDGTVPYPDPFEVLGQIPDLSDECSFLEDHLGREYKTFLRHLGIEDGEIDQLEYQNRDVKEVIHRGLRKWLGKNQHCLSHVLRKVLINALQRAKRKDLADKIENSDYS